MLPFVIDSVDLSAYASARGYSVRYEERTGPNEGTTLAGTIVPDVLARKAVIEWSLDGLSAQRAHQVIVLANRGIVSVTFWDPLTAAQRTGTFLSTLSGLDGAFMRYGKIYFQAGAVLTLREQ